jgi:hypothetical protein
MNPFEFIVAFFSFPSIAIERIFAIVAVILKDPAWALIASAFIYHSIIFMLWIYICSGGSVEKAVGYYRGSLLAVLILTALTAIIPSIQLIDAPAMDVKLLEPDIEGKWPGYMSGAVYLHNLDVWSAVGFFSAASTLIEILAICSFFGRASQIDEGVWG